MKNFVINSTSGMISVASVLDREMAELYTLEVIATDSGTPPKSSSTLIEIHIDDINDSEPQFSQNPYTAVIQVIISLYMKLSENSKQIVAYDQTFN